MSLASVAWRDTSLARASDVFPLAKFSRKRPRETNTRSKGPVSKNVFVSWWVTVIATIRAITWSINMVKNNDVSS